MKTTLKLSLGYALATFALAGCATNRSIANTESQSQYEQTAPVSVDIFYQSLSPYGRWISYPQYGRVWIPAVGRGFEPYATNGYWVYTDYGWTWVSDYSWGWAPFHYGRWLYDDYYGWIWVPGTEWAPAWVAWRNSPDYFGWAPLGPGINISVNIGIPATRWVFVPCRYFGYRNIYRYYLPRQRNTYIIHNTTIINNTNVYNNSRYFSGPRRIEVEHATRRAIRPVKIANTSRPGAARVTGNEISLYRPTVQRSTEQNTGNRPERTPGRTQATDNHRQEAVPERENSDNRPSRVFRGQETDRTNSHPTQPERSNRPAPQRSAPETPPPASNPERRSEPQQTLETNRPVRVFKQPASGHGESRQHENRPVRSSRPSVSTHAAAVHRESASSKASKHARPLRESNDARPHKR